MSEGFFARRPWLWVVIIFLLLIAAWTFLIVTAVKNRPQKVPLDQPPAKETALTTEVPAGWLLS